MPCFQKTLDLHLSESSVNVSAPVRDCQSRQVVVVQICRRLDIIVVDRERQVFHQVNWHNQLTMTAIQYLTICIDDVHMLPA